MVWRGLCKTGMLGSIPRAGLIKTFNFLENLFQTMRELSPKQKGDISELRSFAKLTELGYNIYTPVGEDTRSDCIVESENSLFRIQIKTARYVGESKIRFSCSSSRSNFTETSKEPYGDDIDSFIVFHPDKENFYHVPAEDAPNTSMYLRVKPPKSAQRKNINMAEQYKLTENTF